MMQTATCISTHDATMNFGCQDNSGMSTDTLNTTVTSHAVAATPLSPPQDMATTTLMHCPTRTAGMPIGANIKDTVKNQIWLHKYVDLIDLLYPNRNCNYSLSLTPDSSTPSLTLTQKKNRSLNEAEWSSAMDVFVAVYVQKYPQQLNDILTYVHYIKDLMKQGANWRYYDTNYRLDREFSQCTWTTIRQDLELRSFRGQLSFRNNQTSQTTPSSTSSKPPIGYCFSYHQPGLRCHNKPCKYKHSCPRCHNNHPAFMQCNQQQPKSQQHNNKPTSKPSGPPQTG